MVQKLREKNINEKLLQLVTLDIFNSKKKGVRVVSLRR